jgi:hypothetical protein
VAPHRIDNHVVKLVRSIKDVASVDNDLPLRMGYTIVGSTQAFRRHHLTRRARRTSRPMMTLDGTP